MKPFLTLFAILFFQAGLRAQTVNTQFGQVLGSANGNVYQFLGIPFAKPPVDTLRWKAPQDPDPWTGVLTATSFSPVCPQKHFEQGDTLYTLEGDEDCLHLNIWTPQLGTANLPVMVFIHGGGNQQGSASEVSGGTQMYFGKNLSERGNVVVVTIEYRLGPLGFLVHPGLEQENIHGVSGNYAILDEILALTWVKHNISNFGGDTSRVMIFGESAGGVSVGNLLTTPLAAGLFQRACIESASPVVANYTDTKEKGIDFVNSFISTGSDSAKIAYLRSLPADSLIKSETNPISGGAVQMNWPSVLDGYVFANYPVNVFQSGNYNKVPLMTGSNSEEMSLSAPATVLPAMVTALINATVPPAYQPQAFALYPPGSNATEARKSYVGIETDAQFTVTTRRTAQCVSLNQTEPVWRYFFTYKSPFALLAALGSYHGLELFYVFNNWENSTLGSGFLFTPQDDSLQQSMLAYWTNFAATGDPNISGFPAWPQSQSSTDCYLEMKATPDGSQCGVRTAQSDLWDDVVGFTGCISSLGKEPVAESASISFFPNPSTGIFSINKQGISGLKELRVFNTFGQRILSAPTGNIIDLTSKPDGIYIVIALTADRAYCGKILLSH
ncbi:MAG: carboxylesterase family protein [Bacteroidetes bacterium]|nr:carboxylesterase family protein [Bacteroidota bacterium]